MLSDRGRTTSKWMAKWALVYVALWVLILVVVPYLAK